MVNHAPDPTQSGGRINPGLSALSRPIKWFKQDQSNARKHDQRSLHGIAVSLKKFGQQKPVVVLEDGTVIAGNGTLAAALELGWTSMAAVVFDNADNAKAYALADNKTAELSEWDWDVLAQTLKTLTDEFPDQLVSTGFTDAEVTAILANTSWDGDPSRAAPPPPPDKDYVSQKFFRLRAVGDKAILDVQADINALLVKYGVSLELVG